jgi:hypothetical protein
MSPDVRKALVRSGVSTVVNGHQPFSDGVDLYIDALFFFYT